MNMPEVVEAADEKHTEVRRQPTPHHLDIQRLAYTSVLAFPSQPWLEMLSASKPPISNTPLSPILPPQILRKNRCHLDGSKLKKIIPEWKPAHPKITSDEVKNCIATWKKDGVWPNVKPKKN